MPVTSEQIAGRCREDGEFRLAARYWDGTLAIDLGDERVLDFSISGGQISHASAPLPPVPGIFIAAPREVWDRILAPIPPPLFNDIMPARAFGLTVDGDEETFWQYYSAVRRLVDILREEDPR